MTAALLWISAAAVGALVSGRTARHLSVVSPLRRLNYRGLDVPTAGGLAIILGLLSAEGYLIALHLIARTNIRIELASRTGTGFILAAVGFALLGLWDDVAGRSEERGWRAHLTALRHARATSGVIKLVGGILMAFAMVAFREHAFGWILVDAIVLAASANAFNLLDVRPGRASKWFLLFALVALIWVGGAIGPIVAGACGAVLTFMSYDLRERSMLGDTGANMLGASMGWLVVTTGSHPVKLIVLLLLVVMHTVADRPGISRLIDAVPPLRAFDRVGRVPE